jgi:hypothetical protein
VKSKDVNPQAISANIIGLTFAGDLAFSSATLRQNQANADLAKDTWQRVSMSAFGGKADISDRLADVRF